ncbi:MAG: hypothetical protein JO261_00975 [Alphaproteobacteria bacterium]|nr:hypothetical protein [Alphaproteobacteria bacterium]MBV9692248.1 hypothetical protein [Alphaproteobacteria bacterium]
MFEERVREGFDVFIRDGAHAFGAVRHVRPAELVIYIENAGDFVVPFSSVHDVHSEKVILEYAKLDGALQQAIDRAHRREDPKI